MRPFESYTWQHLLPLVFFLLSGIVTIRIGKRLPQNSQTMLGVVMATIIPVFLIGGWAIDLSNGTFDYKEDLPLYLCRIIAFILPFSMWYRKRFWLGIFYFWVLAGTLQGMITPDLAEGFPSYFYFRYWFLHGGLVVVILYAILVFRMRITWQHFWLALGFAQVYLVLVHLINVFIGSNYSYTVSKPADGTILDLMGPWPWYIFVGEGVMVVLFLLLMLPWLKSRGHRAEGIEQRARGAREQRA